MRYFFLLLIFNFFIIQLSFAEEPYSVPALRCEQCEGGYTCGGMYWRYLSGNQCILKPTDETPLPDMDASCVEGYTSYPTWSGKTRCLKNCKKNFKRDYDEEGFARDKCFLDCPPDKPHYDFEAEQCTLNCNWWEKKICTELGCTCLVCPSDKPFNEATQKCEAPPVEPEEPEEPECEGSLIEAFQCYYNAFNQGLINLDELLKLYFDRIIIALDNISFSSGKSDNNESDLNPTLDNPEIPVVHNSIPNFKYSLFPTSSQCPADKVLNILGGSYPFSYSKLCNALSILGNIVMSIAIYFAYTIIRRD